MTLLRSPLVRPLEEDWRDTLTRIARRRGLIAADEPRRLAQLVSRLSAAYNSATRALPDSKGLLAARLGFSFARDAPKGAGAVRELVATGTLRVPDERPLRLLDLGAGLGAMTWGVVSALQASGQKGDLLATFVDVSRDALSIAQQITLARRDRGTISVRGEFRPGDIVVGRGETKTLGGPFDVILIGQVLSELDEESDVRFLARSSEAIRAAALHLSGDGSIVVVEPALRERTRRLHSLRDELLASGSLNVFAPCLHQSRCPILADPGAWCHEDLDVDLPAWLRPIASEAGLRWQGLTFSYLVLRKDGRSVRDAWPPTERLGRLVSAPIVTKGKREGFVCGELGLPAEGAQRLRVTRLDRDTSAENRPWTVSARGDLLAFEDPIDSTRPRIASGSSVHLRTPTRS
jgi:SAM-dependent methyltransferase